MFLLKNPFFKQLNRNYHHNNKTFKFILNKCHSKKQGNNIKEQFSHNLKPFKFLIQLLSLHHSVYINIYINIIYICIICI